MILPLSESETEQSFQKSLIEQKKWQLSSKEDRIRVIEGFNSYFLDNRNEIGHMISSFMGRPIRFSPKEVETAVIRAEVILDRFRSFSFQDLLDKNREINHIPLGNILIFGAWNYPLLTAVNSIIPALLTGNSVSFRPSFQTFFAGEVFEKALTSSGLPKNVFSVTSFSHESTEKIVQSRNIHGLVYTGSTEGGKKIHHWCSGNFIPVTMELGGKDAAYVRFDADLKSAAENIADGAFFNSGQSCCGVERVYVHESIYEEVLDLVIKEARKLVLGDPLSKETTLGPMAKSDSVAFLKNQYNFAKANGAISHLDDLGEINPTGGFIRPVVMTNCSDEMSIQQEETFGPFVTISPVKSDEEAVLRMNNSKFGLTASIWTKDRDNARLLARELNVGLVLVNRCDYVEPSLPWRGEKETGMGQALGPNCFLQYLKPHSVLMS